MAKSTILLCTLKQLHTNNSLSSDFPSFFFSVIQPVIKHALKIRWLNKMCNLLIIIVSTLSCESVPLHCDSLRLFEHIGLCSRKQ